MPLTGGWSYDNEGRITKIDYPGGSAPGDAAPISVLNFYDANGRPLKMESSQGACANVAWASKATYNEASQLTGLERFDSLVACGSPSIWNIFNQSWQYNVNSQLTEIDTSQQSTGYPVGSGAPGAANVYWQRYYYSATKNNGQVTQVDDARLGYSINYTYDSLSRLTKADAGANWVQTYGYDGFGNLTSKSTPPGSGETPMPSMLSAKNRLGNASYDLNGNVTAVDTGTYSYDVENRLVGSNYAPLGISYDEANRRVEDGGLYFYSPDGQLLTTFQENLGANPTTHLLTTRIYFGGLIVGEIGASGYSRVLNPDRVRLKC
jgi:YD repeat-containing protein